jgi:putative ABC transport system permease protein
MQVRFYRLLLRAFPRDFRGRFGNDMADVFADRLREARGHGALALATFWLRTIVDLIAHGLAERRAGERLIPRRPAMLSTWKQDVMFGLRTIRRAPGTAVLAVVMLALGIGASTAVFSVAEAFVLRALPYPAAERLVALTDDQTKRGQSVNVALPNFDDWRASVAAIDAAAAWQTADVNLVATAAAERVVAASVTEEFFDVVGAVPVAGTTFGREIDQAPRIVVSERVWRQLFGARRDAIGTSVVVDGVASNLVGVIPNVAGLMEVDVWRPIVRTGAATRRTSHAYRAIARLKPAVSIDEARVQFDVVAARLASAYPDSNAGWSVGLTPLQETLTADLDQVLVLISGVAALLLVIACTNVAGLLVARAADRRREFAVRAALGAPRARLIRQLLTESVMVSLTGAALGLVVAAWATGLIMTLVPEDVVAVREPSLSLQVLGFSTLVAITTGLLFGLAPALTAARPVSQDRLRDAAVATSVVTRRLRHALVFVQITLAAVLLVGSGLLAMSLWRAVRIDPGLDPRSVLTFRVTPPRGTHTDAAALHTYFDALLGRLAALPQVEAVGAVSSLPMADDDTISSVRRADEPAPARGKERWALHQVSTPGYVRASGTRLIAGRDFTDTDVSGGERVTMVNESLARQLWPGVSPIGRDLVLEPDTPHRVIGLIADVRQFGLDQRLFPQYFVPFRQAPVRSLSVALRLRSPLSHDELRTALATVDRAIPLYSLRTFESITANSLRARRNLAGTVAFCGATAVLLAAIGLYGIVATGVRDRRREIGIRIALGASRASVVALFVWRATLLAACGVGAGLIASSWTTGLVEQFLFQIERLDAATLSGVAGILMAVTIGATWWSARHAARVNPIETLRTD